MTDRADDATVLVEEHDGRSLRAALVSVPPGVPGECERCFEHSPRLIDGRCAPCRDGRWRV